MGAMPVFWNGFRVDNAAMTDRHERERRPGRLSKLGGFSVDEFLQMPDLPPHTELMDGELVFVSPQRRFHLKVVRLLESSLLAAAPAHFEVLREMNTVIDMHHAPEPDLMIVPVEALGSLDEVSYPAGVVLLAVEVESPDSINRDRIRKPGLYAEGGIQHYWRVERLENDQPIVHVHELDQETRSYRVTGVHHERLQLTVPFAIDIDLTGIK